MSATTCEEDTGVDESKQDGHPRQQRDASGDASTNHSPAGPRETDGSVSQRAATRLDESRDDITDLVAVFKLLSDETRLKILYVLRDTDEMNVLELCGILKQRQPSVSHHLALLRSKGLIGMRRDGKHNFYHMLPARLDKVAAAVLQVAPGSQGGSGIGAGDGFVPGDGVV